MKTEKVKKEKKRDKKTKYVSIKYVILSITTLPLLFACGMLAIFSSLILERGIKNQAVEGLRIAATGALLSLDNISMESFQLIGSDLYKGDFNITQNMGAIDYYAEANNIEITFYYGSKATATTITDAKGNRAVGETADSKVVSAVLKKGQEYQVFDLLINDEPYYGYYMPVNDTDGNIIGMVFAGTPRAESFSYIKARVGVIMFIAFLNYISCAIISSYVSKKRFISPLHKLTEAAKELAKGKINLKIEKTENNEFGDLTDSFIALSENIEKQAHIAEKMADGDLTVHYTPAGDEDVMGLAIQKMVKDNNYNLSIINQAADRMSAGVREIASASNSLAQGTTAQASAIEEITASIAGIAASADVNAQDANKANELIITTRDEAFRGNEQMQHMMKAMEDINTASENISHIMQAIDDIASQTNIISLNASVEAARAGAHGKGFAVVATEIRELASKSANAAQNSAELVSDAIKKAEIGSKLAAETAAALDEILRSVENMTSLISGIAEASVNQSGSVNQVNTGITQIADVLQTNSATSEQCAAACNDLTNLAEQLRNAVEKYRLDMSAI